MKSYIFYFLFFDLAAINIIIYVWSDWQYFHFVKEMFLNSTSTTLICTYIQFLRLGHKCIHSAFLGDILVYPLFDQLGSCKMKSEYVVTSDVLKFT